MLKYIGEIIEIEDVNVEKFDEILTELELFTDRLSAGKEFATKEQAFLLSEKMGKIADILKDAEDNFEQIKVLDKFKSNKIVIADISMACGLVSFLVKELQLHPTLLEEITQRTINKKEQQFANSAKKELHICEGACSRFPREPVAQEYFDKVIDMPLDAFKATIKQYQTNGILHKRDNFGNTLLIYGADKMSIDKVKYVIDQGSKINIKNFAGETPLTIAIYNPDIEVAEFLIRRSGLAFERDSNSDNILHILCNIDFRKICNNSQKENWTEIIENILALDSGYLIARSKNLSGKMPLDCLLNNKTIPHNIAVIWGQKLIEKML